MIVVRFLYAVAIAVLLILLVIFGVEAFYPEPPYPQHPEYPTVSHEDPEWQQIWDEWQQEREKVDEAYRQELAVYHRSVFLVILPLGVVFAIGGTFVRRKLDIFGAGLILGGMGTMILAVVPSELDDLFRFAGIAVALVVLIFVGFRVFSSARAA